eukprot:3617248-Rhodomonas_salina.3
MVLRAAYAMSGTDLAYGCAVSAYALAMRWPALRECVHAGKAEEEEEGSERNRGGGGGSKKGEREREERRAPDWHQELRGRSDPYPPTRLLRVVRYRHSVWCCQPTRLLCDVRAADLGVEEAVVGPSLCCYALAMQCPVLRKRMVCLPIRARYAMSGAVIGCGVVCYAMSGTEQRAMMCYKGGGVIGRYRLCRSP